MNQNARTSQRDRRSSLRIEPLEERCVLSVATLGASEDTFLRSGQNNGASEILDSRYSFVPYIQFDLSALSIDAITDATLTVTKVSAMPVGGRNDGIVTGRFAVYGLTSQAGNTPQDWDESTLVAGTNSGLEWVDDSLQDGVDRTRVFSLDADDGANVFESVVNGTDVQQQLTGPDLVTFLNDRVDDNGLVTFIIPVEADGGTGYGLASKENATSAFHPMLELTYDESSDPDPDPYPENPVVLPRQMERLDRGLIAMRRSTSQVYLGWRLLGDDPADVAFNLYRSAAGAAAVKLNGAPLTQTTDFVDTTANLSVANEYFVRAVVDGVQQDPSETYLLPAFAPVRQFLEVPLEIPAPTTTSDGEQWHYTANDASVGDLDGDGDYEIIMKWTAEPTNPDPDKNYIFSLTPNMFVDAYDMDGTMLWRIDVQNVRTIASSLQFIVYDLDGDGRAEVAMNTGDGTTSYTASGSVGNWTLTQNDVVGDPNANWVNPDGWVTTGPEYLTIFDGLTGDVLVSTDLAPERGSVSDWGDNYGHRSTTHKYVVAYIDGQRPSLVTGRGIYHGQVGVSKTSLVAWNWRDGQLTQEWAFVATEGVPGAVNPEYVGQGNQAVSVADVDGDGFDEVVWGAMVVDHDGTGLYSTGRGHGDALHVADMDPSNPGLEIFEPHENPAEYGTAGGDYRDAMTGELLIAIPGGGDVGRGVAFDIDPNYPGYEFWTSTGEPGTGRVGIYNVQAGRIYDGAGLGQSGYTFMNFGVWWDADPLREQLDGTTIAKWHYEWATPGRSNVVWYGASGINNNSGLSSNNGSKSNPALSADILGDWREEVIWRKSDNSALQVWTTTIDADMRLPTLMHDLQYREAVAWQNVYYNQPPHPSYFIGADMGPAPLPPLFFGGELQGDYNSDGAVDAADYAVWRNALSSQNLAADGDHNGLVDQEDYNVWRSHYGSIAQAAPASTQRTLYGAASASVSESLADAAALSFAYSSPVSALETAQASTVSGDSLPAAPQDNLLLYLAATNEASANTQVDLAYEDPIAAGDSEESTDAAFELLGEDAGLASQVAR